MSRAFGTSSRVDRERRRRAVDMRKDVRKNGEKVHDRRWMIAAAVIVLGLLLWFHVI